MKKTFAEIYDSMMEYVDYDEWARLIDKKISPFIEDKNMLEIGCGTGEIVVRMQKKGYKVEAIDNSIEMLKLAKEKYKNIEFITLPSPSPRFAAITKAEKIKIYRKLLPKI